MPLCTPVPFVLATQAAVWLCGGATGEWNYRVSADYSFVSDYNSDIVAEFCATRPADANCTAPSVADRDSAGVGNRFLSAGPAGARAIAYNRHLNNKTTVAIQRLASAVSAPQICCCFVGLFVLSSHALVCKCARVHKA